MARPAEGTDHSVGICIQGPRCGFANLETVALIATPQTALTETADTLFVLNGPVVLVRNLRIMPVLSVDLKEGDEPPLCCFVLCRLPLSLLMSLPHPCVTLPLALRWSEGPKGGASCWSRHPPVSVLHSGGGGSIGEPLAEHPEPSAWAGGSDRWLWSVKMYTQWGMCLCVHVGLLLVTVVFSCCIFF